MILRLGESWKDKGSKGLIRLSLEWKYYDVKQNHDPSQSCSGNWGLFIFSKIKSGILSSLKNVNSMLNFTRSKFLIFSECWKYCLLVCSLIVYILPLILVLHQTFITIFHIFFKHLLRPFEPKESSIISIINNAWLTFISLFAIIKSRSK